MRRGLVLSGGAALGAYQAGVLRALHEAGLEFEIISATSIGSINAAAWNIADVIGELHEHWYHNVNTLKPFDPMRVFRAQNPFRFHATLEQLTDNYRARYPFDNERAEILITVADYATHQLKTFSTSDATIPQSDRELFMKASTAILHIGSEAVEIAGQKYYDGGYYNNVPLEPLLDRDLDEIWIVPLSPVLVGGAQLPSRTMNLARAKKLLPFAYSYSLLSFIEQMYNPPNMDRGDARKVVISPFHSKVITPTLMRQSLLFSLKSVERLIAGGYEDGVRAVEDYFSS